MKRRILKVVAVMLVLSMVVIFTGCGQSSNDSSNGTSAEPSKSEKGNSSDVPSGMDVSKKVNLKMITFGNPPKDLDRVTDEVNKIVKEKINATVSYEPLGIADWRTKYNLMLTSGEDIDIIWTANWNNYFANALNGAYLPLDDYLNTVAKGLYDAYPKDVWELSKVNGKTYTIPSNMPIYAEWGFLYREDLREKYNLPEITDLNSIEEYLLGIKENDSEILPMVDISEVGPFHSYSAINHMYTKFGAVQNSYGIGVNMDNPRELIRFTETDSFREYAQMMKRWVDEGLERSDVLSSKEDVWQAVRTGKYASGIASSDPARMNTNVIVPASIEHPDWKFGYIHWGEIGKISFKTHPTFMGTALPKSCKNPERAMMFLNLVATNKELNRLMDDGIEGVHYKVDENGYYVSLENEDPKYTQESAGTKSLSFFSDFKLYPKSYDFVMDVYDRLAPYEVPNIYEGFVEDYTSYNAERAALGQVWTQYGLPVIVGIVPDVDEAIETLNKKMKAAGSDKIYEEVSKQWEAYMDNIGQ